MFDTLLVFLLTLLVLTSAIQPWEDTIMTMVQSIIRQVQVFIGNLITITGEVLEAHLPLAIFALVTYPSILPVAGAIALPILTWEYSRRNKDTSKLYAFLYAILLGGILTHATTADRVLPIRNFAVQAFGKGPFSNGDPENDYYFESIFEKGLIYQPIRYEFDFPTILLMFGMVSWMMYWLILPPLQSWYGKFWQECRRNSYLKAQILGPIVMQPTEYVLGPIANLLPFLRTLYRLSFLELAAPELPDRPQLPFSGGTNGDTTVNDNNSGKPLPPPLSPTDISIMKKWGLVVETETGELVVVDKKASNTETTKKRDKKPATTGGLAQQDTPKKKPSDTVSKKTGTPKETAKSTDRSPTPGYIPTPPAVLSKLCEDSDIEQSPGETGSFGTEYTTPVRAQDIEVLSQGFWDMYAPESRPNPVIAPRNVPVAKPRKAYPSLRERREAVRRLYASMPYEERYALQIKEEREKEEARGEEEACHALARLLGKTTPEGREVPSPEESKREESNVEETVPDTQERVKKEVPKVEETVPFTEELLKRVEPKVEEVEATVPVAQEHEKQKGLEEKEELDELDEEKKKLKQEKQKQKREEKKRKWEEKKQKQQEKKRELKKELEKELEKQKELSEKSLKKTAKTAEVPSEQREQCVELKEYTTEMDLDPPEQDVEVEKERQTREKVTLGSSKSLAAALLMAEIVRQQQLWEAWPSSQQMISLFAAEMGRVNRELDKSRQQMISSFATEMGRVSRELEEKWLPQKVDEESRRKMEKMERIKGHLKSLHPELTSPPHKSVQSIRFGSKRKSDDRSSGEKKRKLEAKSVKISVPFTRDLLDDRSELYRYNMELRKWRKRMAEDPAEDSMPIYCQRVNKCLRRYRSLLEVTLQTLTYSKGHEEINDFARFLSLLRVSDDHRVDSLVHVASSKPEPMSTISSGPDVDIKEPPTKIPLQSQNISVPEPMDGPQKSHVGNIDRPFTPFQVYNPTWQFRCLPGLSYDSDDEIEDFVREPSVSKPIATSHLPSQKTNIPGPDYDSDDEIEDTTWDSTKSPATGISHITSHLANLYRLTVNFSDSKVEEDLHPTSPLTDLFGLSRLDDEFLNETLPDHEVEEPLSESAPTPGADAKATPAYFASISGLTCHCDDFTIRDVPVAATVTPVEAQYISAGLDRLVDYSCDSDNEIELFDAEPKKTEHIGKPFATTSNTGNTVLQSKIHESDSQVIDMPDANETPSKRIGTSTATSSSMADTVLHLGILPTQNQSLGASRGTVEPVVTRPLNLRPVSALATSSTPRSKTARSFITRSGQASGKKVTTMEARTMLVPTCVQALDQEDDSESVMHYKGTAKGKGKGKTQGHNGDTPGSTGR